MLLEASVTPAAWPGVSHSPFEIIRAVRAPQALLDDLIPRLKRMPRPRGWSFTADEHSATLVSASGSTTHIVVQDGPQTGRSVYPVVSPAVPSSEVMICLSPTLADDDAKVAAAVRSIVQECCDVYCDAEVAAILKSMPLLDAFATPADPALSDVALIFRDHFLEDHFALMLALLRAGVAPEWMMALAKGDRSPGRHRIAAHLRRLGCHVDTFDNAVFNDPVRAAAEGPRMTAILTTFARNARAAGKRVVLIDDGALLVQSLREHQELIDAALEVTIVGIRRIEAVGSALQVPVFDVARSRLKTVITYQEIAQSCVRRIWDLLGAEKLIGRPVLVMGYGTAGQKIARMLRDMGCLVSVTDSDIIALIAAAERGFRTFRSTSDALRLVQPFLTVGCTGDVPLTAADIERIPDRSYVTACATRDLGILQTVRHVYEAITIPAWGTQFRRPDGTGFFQLGDGRSINLFESEAIPNRANDLFKTGIFLATRELGARAIGVGNGIHREIVDDLFETSGLLASYYDMYFSDATLRTTR